MLKFNKTIKMQLINAVMTAKYKPRFEAAMRELSVAARKWAVENSLHNLAIKSQVGLRPFIGKRSEIYFAASQYISEIKDILGHDSRYVEYIRFDDPVYCLTGKLPSDFPELLAVFAVVDECEATLVTLSSVVHSYTKAEKLFEDLPWIKEFYPDLPVTGTSLIASEQIAKLNEVMGSC